MKQYLLWLLCVFALKAQSQTKTSSIWWHMPLNSILGYWGTQDNPTFCHALIIEKGDDGYTCGLQLYHSLDWLSYKKVEHLKLVDNSLVTKYGTFTYNEMNNTLVGVDKNQSIIFYRITDVEWMRLGHCYKKPTVVVYPKVPITKNSTLMSIKQAERNAEKDEVIKAEIEKANKDSVEEANYIAWESSRIKPPKGSNMHGCWESRTRTFSKAIQVIKDGGLYTVIIVTADGSKKVYENLTVHDDRLRTSYGDFEYVQENDVMIDQSLDKPIKFVRITEEDFNSIYIIKRY